ncbi:MAG: aminodeoxychorismate synthase component I [Methylomonas sp.]|nr:aminodeoxychorismate synthase component I [Methylomonas sp.]PPD19258.1 MAG: aminodeoxychorismate synthase, component I [Methylomonas sp.]PPD24972.1 MAG: aminodeoxychorismate synthase, component I [Methylomonas sp.]PPD34149.1 MAG: aminodeoxychorismate synthase, component I [Methylomonas sp.]PPD38382.1 MAG: aminodeoxychorismate synthase, component I [Methylomonas sp.]
MPQDLPIKHALPYHPDSACLFAAMAGKPWAVFLDSAFPVSRQGRFDILAHSPDCTLQTVGDVTTIEQAGNIVESREAPFELLKRQLGLPKPGIVGLPFCGGALGYFGYDLARRIERLPALARDDECIPDMAIGIYRWAVVVDHVLQQSWLVGYGLAPQTVDDLLADWSASFDSPVQGRFHVEATPQANMSRSDYAQAFARIKHYLKEGDCYQVNLTQRFSSPCAGDPWLAYRALRQVNAAPFSAYLNFPDVQVLSSSPERFLKLASGQVETKPIKGTRPRRADAEADAAQKQSLANSEKDRAENVMIVDLLRNDIGKCCRQGSVKAQALFTIETYATVHHLVSTVTGELAAGETAVDLLRSCFPGGSITGAPKIRAMQIIEELEPHRRGVYCGAIGYIGFDGNMDTNIAIRTLVHNRGTIRFWVGGGIVDDSRVDDEYQECFDKAAAMFQVLSSFSTTS